MVGNNTIVVSLVQFILKSYYTWHILRSPPSSFFSSLITARPPQPPLQEEEKSSPCHPEESLTSADLVKQSVNTK